MSCVVPWVLFIYCSRLVKGTKRNTMCQRKASHAFNSRGNLAEDGNSMEMESNKIIQINFLRRKAKIHWQYGAAVEGAESTNQREILKLNSNRLYVQREGGKTLIYLREFTLLNSQVVMKSAGNHESSHDLNPYKTFPRVHFSVCIHTRSHKAC